MPVSLCPDPASAYAVPVQTVVALGLGTDNDTVNSKAAGRTIDSAIIYKLVFE
jgi:hypothetical protein